jgi:hypothetical protein
MKPDQRKARSSETAPTDGALDIASLWRTVFPSGKREEPMADDVAAAPSPWSRNAAALGDAGPDALFRDRLKIAGARYGIW